MSESEDKRLEEMALAWWAKWAVDLSSYSCGLGVHVEWAQDENEELVAMLRQVQREERERAIAARQEWRSRMGLSTQDEIVKRAEAAEARLREVEAERDAALSGRQHEYLLRVEGERDAARAERDAALAAQPETPPALIYDLQETQAERDELRARLDEAKRIHSQDYFDMVRQNKDMDALRAEVERLRVEKGEMALVLEQQNCTLTKEHDRAEKAEAALRSAEERVLHLLSHPGNPVGYTRDWVALIFKQERGAPAVVTTKPQHTKDCVETYNVSEGTAGCTCGIEP